MGDEAKVIEKFFVFSKYNIVKVILFLAIPILLSILIFMTKYGIKDGWYEYTLSLNDQHPAKWNLAAVLCNTTASITMFSLCKN